MATIGLIIYNKNIHKRLKEADKIISGKKKVKSYTNVDEMFEDLDK